MSDTIEIAGVSIAPGERKIVRVPVAARFIAGNVEIPAVVVRGRKPGPRLFVSAALHGDEINGTEIVRRLLGRPLLRKLRGTLVAVPVVNVYGFVTQERYLPDRRDLNRSFPGSAKGSLAARLADAFLTNFVKGSTHGIDLHTGAIHRSNLPQIRARLSSKETEEMARAFGAP
ncbi:MAG: M14 family metallopeptidase, partial [bacterium]